MYLNEKYINGIVKYHLGGHKLNTRLLANMAIKTNNAKELAFAMGISTSWLYRQLKANHITTNFKRGSKVRKIRPTQLDFIMSGVSINKRPDTRLKPAIRQALGGVCRCCGISDVDCLEIDHIDGNRNNTQIDNLQLLCSNCHSKKTAQDRRNGLYA